MRRRMRFDLSLLSGAVLAGAAMLCALSLILAVASSPLPVVYEREEAGELFFPADDQARAAVTIASLPSDPFSANRNYRPAAGPVSGPRVERDSSAFATAPRLLGTVLRGDSSFAVIQLASESPRIARIGAQVGDLVLVVLEQGRAIFAAPDGARITVSLSPRGS